jgi:hypothetical protein
MLYDMEHCGKGFGILELHRKHLRQSGGNLTCAIGWATVVPAVIRLGGVGRIIAFCKISTLVHLGAQFLHAKSKRPTIQWVTLERSMLCFFFTNQRYKKRNVGWLSRRCCHSEKGNGEGRVVSIEVRVPHAAACRGLGIDNPCYNYNCFLPIDAIESRLKRSFVASPECVKGTEFSL